MRIIFTHWQHLFWRPLPLLQLRTRVYRIAVMSSVVASLVQQCQFYILMHLEKFPVDYLSLLPLSTRKALLWQLPLADVFQLQETQFILGLECEVVECLMNRCDTYIGTADEDNEVERYIKERWNGHSMAYAREILYGQLVTSMLGCLQEFSFELPNGQSLYSNSDIEDFLCGIRIRYQDPPLSAYSFTFPPRHTCHHVGNPDQLLTNEQLVSYFDHKRPKLLGEVCIPGDFFPNFGSSDLDFELSILKEVEQLGFECMPFESLASEFIAMTVRNAKRLEVLVLKGDDDPSNTPIHIDTLCDELTFCTAFWSTFKIFKIMSRSVLYEESGDETSSLEYAISRYTFDKVIKAYFAAPTDHDQLVQFTDMKIEGDSSDRSPTIDPTYLMFKTVRLENCQFVSSSKATPKTIASWLGREINVLDNKPDSYLFQVKDSGKHGQKRKHPDPEE